MVSVELALIGSLVLLPLTLGAVDAAQLLATRNRMDQALHQAFLAAYAYADTNNAPIPGPTDEVDAVIGFLTGTAPLVIALPVQYCIAPATGYPITGTPSLAVAGVCTASGTQPEWYLNVTVSSTVTLAFSVPWTAQTVTLSTSGTARIL